MNNPQITTEQETNFARRPGEANYDFERRIAGLIQFYELRHPNPDSIFDHQLDEPRIEKAWNGSAYVDVFIPSVEYRASSDTYAYLPPFKIIDSTDENNPEPIDGIDDAGDLTIHPLYLHIQHAADDAAALLEHHPQRSYTIISCTSAWLQTYSVEEDDGYWDDYRITNTSDDPDNYRLVDIYADDQDMIGDPTPDRDDYNPLGC